MTASLYRLRLWTIVAAGLVLIATGLVVRSRLTPPDVSSPVQTVKRSDVVEKEGLILELTPRLGRLLNTSARNLTIPDPMCRELFAEQVEVTGLADGEPDPVTELRSAGVERFRWKTSPRELRTRSSLQLWQPVWNSIEFVERATFYVVQADYTADQPPRLLTEIGFEAVARSKTGRLVSLKARSEVHWRFLPGSPKSAADLEIVSWVTRSFESDSMRVRMYEEALDQVLTDVQLRDRLRSSRHEELILERHAWLMEQQAKQSATSAPDDARMGGAAETAFEKWPGPHPWFSNVSQDRHPSVSVVDIDRDGFDDLYVMDRWRRNVLLRNRQDGTYEDIAAAVGLDFEGDCTTAIFADFDNDGDPDLFLGRSLQPGLFLENVEGLFVDRTDSNVKVRMPALITSAAAADYNGDGLLDIYLSTYSAHLLQDQFEESETDSEQILLKDFLPPEDAEHLRRLIETPEHHRYFRFAGPPNLLLVNLGQNRFAEAPENEQLQGWRHTYQATWNDYDGDGDPDLYVANDFATNNLFRNDGSGHFMDVAEETGTTDIGFGMGVAWGDYDADGRADLYVSNMYSKAGRRITGQLDSIDERFGRMARGNSLFRNQGDEFTKVSGLEKPALQVEQAGWSWASQFCDVDNDGWLDLYALSGYYTAPPQVAVQVDL